MQKEVASKLPKQRSRCQRSANRISSAMTLAADAMLVNAASRANICNTSMSRRINADLVTMPTGLRSSAYISKSPDEVLYPVPEFFCDVSTVGVLRGLVGRKK